MATRSMTFIMDDDNILTPIACIYRHFDGYPNGHGQSLYNFLANRKVVNGLDTVKPPLTVSNTMGDLATQLIAYLKNKYPVANVYLRPIPRLPKKKETSEDYILDLVDYARDCGCEYVYIVRPFHENYEEKIEVKVIETYAGTYPDCLFSGEVKEMKSAFDFNDEDLITENTERF